MKKDLQGYAVSAFLIVDNQFENIKSLDYRFGSYITNDTYNEWDIKNFITTINRVINISQIVTPLDYITTYYLRIKKKFKIKNDRDIFVFCIKVAINNLLERRYDNRDLALTILNYSIRLLVVDVKLYNQVKEFVSKFYYNKVKLSMRKGKHEILFKNIETEMTMGNIVLGYLGINDINKCVRNGKNIFLHRKTKIKEEFITNKLDFLYKNTSNGNIILRKGFTIIKKIPILEGDLKLYKNKNQTRVRSVYHEIIVSSIFTLMNYNIKHKKFKKYKIDDKIFNINFLRYNGFFMTDAKHCNLLMECADTTLYKLIKEGYTFNFFTLKCILFQLVFYVYTIQKYFKAVHHDLHFKNIFLKKIPRKFSHIKYRINEEGKVKKEFILPNCGYIVKIGDLEFTSIYKGDVIIRYDINLFKKYNICDKYQPNYDLSMILISFINHIKNINFMRRDDKDKFHQLISCIIKLASEKNISFETFKSKYFIKNRPTYELSQKNIVKDLLFSNLFESYSNSGIVLKAKTYINMANI